jgi:NNP family nitrate/nitrite transporter-like MFS transporter
MTARESFLKSGHLPTLVAALLYFDVSFMVWVLLGPLAPFLREEFGLTATEQGLLVALAGGGLRAYHARFSGVELAYALEVAENNG